MPELPPTILYCKRSSKSSSSPWRHRMKVLPCVGFSAVVRPVIAPSWTDQNSGLPSQPSRSFPLKIGLKPDSSSAGLFAGPLAQAARPNANATNHVFTAAFSHSRFMKHLAPIGGLSCAAARRTYSAKPDFFWPPSLLRTGLWSVMDRKSALALDGMEVRPTLVGSLRAA